MYADCSAGSLILQGLTENIQERFYSYKGHMKESKEEVVWYNYMFLLLCVVCSYLCQCMWVSFPQRRIFCSACAKRRNTYFVKHQSRRHSFHSSKFLLYSCHISKWIVTQSWLGLSSYNVKVTLILRDSDMLLNLFVYQPFRLPT